MDTDLKALEIFNEDVFPTPALFGEAPAYAELLEKAGVLDPSLDLQEVRARFAGLTVEAPEAPTPTIGKEEVIEDTTSETTVIEESFRLDALPKIAEALTAKVSADEFVDLCESVGFDLMRKRQEACDAVVSPRNTDEENIIAMAAEVATFNPIIVRYIGYLLDALEAQITLGATLDEVTTMLSEVEELITLIADRFSCGNEYLDRVANEKAPIREPEDGNQLHKRIDSLKKLRDKQA